MTTLTTIDCPVASDQPEGKTKTCTRCHEEKPATLEYFYLRKGKRQNSLGSWCKVCVSAKGRHRYDNPVVKQRMNEMAAQYRKNHPEVYRSAKLKLQYGISAEEKAEILESQSGGCAICRTHSPKKHWAVDHDHNTGLIRGILCEHCNWGLGHFKDSPELLLAAYQYLKINGVVGCLNEP